jgi:hypothetical protein
MMSSLLKIFATGHFLNSIPYALYAPWPAIAVFPEPAAAIVLGFFAPIPEPNSREQLPATSGAFNFSHSVKNIQINRRVCFAPYYYAVILSVSVLLQKSGKGSHCKTVRDT